MIGSAAPYIMSATMMLFSGLSALTLFAFVRSLDRPEPKEPEQRQITRPAA